jgi:hypothetical protein
MIYVLNECIPKTSDHKFQIHIYKARISPLNPLQHNDNYVCHPPFCPQSVFRLCFALTIYSDWFSTTNRLIFAIDIRWFCEREELKRKILFAWTWLLLKTTGLQPHYLTSPVQVCTSSDQGMSVANFWLLKPFPVGWWRKVIRLVGLYTQPLPFCRSFVGLKPV